MRALVALAVLLFAAPALAETVKLAWDPNPEPYLAGYNLYRSAQAGDLGNRINTSLITTAAFSDTSTEAGKTYFYAVKAVSSGGGESDPSNILRVLVPSIGPVGWWKMDEAAGSTASDSSGFANPGALLSGAAWTAAGRLAGGLSLKAPGQAVRIPGLLSNPWNVTIAGWANLRRAGSEGATLISLGDHVAIRLDDFNGEATGFFYDGSTWHATGVKIRYAGTGWHHFAYVINADAGTQAFYIDGVLKAATTHPGNPLYAGLGADTVIGKHGAGASTYDFAGEIDDVRIYNRALAASEITALLGRLPDTAAPSIRLD